MSMSWETPQQARLGAGSRRQSPPARGGFGVTAAGGFHRRGRAPPQQRPGLSTPTPAWALEPPDAFSGRASAAAIHGHTSRHLKAGPGGGGRLPGGRRRLLSSVPRYRGGPRSTAATQRFPAGRRRRPGAERRGGAARRSRQPGRVGWGRGRSAGCRSPPPCPSTFFSRDPQVTVAGGARGAGRGEAARPLGPGPA